MKCVEIVTMVSHHHDETMGDSGSGFCFLLFCFFHCDYILLL